MKELAVGNVSFREKINKLLLTVFYVGLTSFENLPAVNTEICVEG